MRTAQFLATLALALGLASCGSGDVGPNGGVVGGRCTLDSQCTKRCVIDDNKFPGGYCTMTCARDADCPNGTVCVGEKGGVCMITCRQQGDCSAFGPAYQCADVDRQGIDGRALVCIGVK